MKKKRHSLESIMRILKAADTGAEIPELCREHDISEQTFYRWRRKYADMDLSDARKLRELEDENRRLKALVADQALKIQASGNWWNGFVSCRGKSSATATDGSRRCSDGMAGGLAARRSSGFGARKGCRPGASRRRRFVAGLPAAEAVAWYAPVKREPVDPLRVLE
ncbi:MAG: transposase [Opitutales bacterium]